MVSFKSFRTVAFRSFEEFDFEGSKDFLAGLKQILKSGALAQGEGDAGCGSGGGEEEEQVLKAKIFFYSK